MRILIAGQTYFPQPNGQAVFTTRLAEGLAQRGHTVWVLTPANAPRREVEGINQVRVVRFPSVPLSPLHRSVRVTLFARRPVRHLIETLRPDVVHIQDHYFISRAAVDVARQHHIPLLGTNHFLPENLMRNMPRPINRGAWLQRILWRTMLDVYNRLDMVTTPTETAATILREQGIRPPVHPVSCGVDLSAFHPVPEINCQDTWAYFGLPNDMVTFLFVGRIDGEKRLDVFLRAMHLVGRSDIRAVIAGKGFYLAELKALARRLGIAHQVYFLGYVPSEDLNRLLNCAHVFVMPSEAELQSIATLEAMATGKPILGANARALPELIHPGENGYLFRPGDPEDMARYMRQLLQEQERWPLMGAVSMRIAQEHSLERTLDRYKALYDQIQRYSSSSG